MPSSAEAKVHLVNRALVKLGLRPSYTTDQASELGAMVEAVFDPLLAEVATNFDFPFLRQTLALDPLAGPPQNGWPYGFKLPATRIGSPLSFLDQVYPRERYLREFMLEAGNVYAACTVLWGRFRILLDPQYWDEGFAEAYVTGLAGRLAVPMTQDAELEEARIREAFGSQQEQRRGGLFGRLIAMNKAAEPQGRGFMDSDLLTQARW